jgi:raffinose/stachyose/melibiose transport system permease protein
MEVKGKKIAILIFTLPAICLYTFFLFIPIFASLGLSFFKWDGFGPIFFNGLQNYIDVFVHNIDSFWGSAGNSLLFAVLCVVIQLPLALILALVLSNGVKGENFFRTAYFMPVIISSVIIGALFSKVYNPDYGLLNTILGKIGLGSLKRMWLGDPKTALLAAFVPQIWQFIGYHMLLMYAAIKQVPNEIIEAAKIDGAGSFQIATKIKIPLIKPMLEVCLIFAVTGSLKIFDLIYVLTPNGGPLNSTQIPTGLMFKELFTNYSTGIGSTIAVFIVAECLIFTFLIQRIFKEKIVEI